MATLKELLEQQKSLAEQIAKLQVEEHGKALQQVKELINDFGLTEEEVFGKPRAPRGSKAPTKKGEAKYRSSIDPNITWSGKGRKPEWVITYLANGGKLDELLINKTS